MASRSDITYGIGADTTQASRQVQQFIRRTQAQVNAAPMRLRLDTRGFTQPLGRISSDLNQFQSAMDASIARTLAFGASVGVINGVAKAFSNLVSTTVRVEEALSNINVLLNLSSSQLSKFSDDLFDIAKNTAQSFDQVAIAATEFSRQGLSAAETGQRVNAALILTRLSGLDAAKSVESLTAAVNGFRREGITTTEVVNRLANVDAAFAVSSADLANALARSGAVAQDAKVSFNQLLAATTAVQQATARGGSVIGNGFKTIFTRLQRSKVLDELENIGVATRTSTGEIRGAIDILKDYATVYKTLGDEQRAFTAEQIAGVFQINTLKSFVNDLSSEFGIYNKALEKANLTSDEAIQRNEVLNETLQSLLSQTGTEVERTLGKIGKLALEDNFKGLFTVIKGSLEDLNRILNSEGLGGDIAKGLVKGIGNFISGPGLVIIGAGLFKLLKFVAAESATAFKQVLLIGSETQKRAQVQERVNRLLQEDNALLRQIMSSNGSVESINRAVEQSIIRQNQQLEFQRNLVRQISASTTISKSGVLGFNPRGGRGRSAAEGYIPNLINKEKREMPAGSKVVALRDFKTPQGPTTMIANTSETMVSNFAGSGFPAILTREQSRGMGASRGFLPNFAKTFTPTSVQSKAIALNNMALIPRNTKTRADLKRNQGFTDEELDDLNFPRRKSKSGVKKSAQSVFDANKRGFFMAVPQPIGQDPIFVDFETPRKSKTGKKYDAFVGTAFGVNEGLEESESQKIRQLSNIDKELTDSLSDAGERILTRMIPFNTDPSAAELGAGNIKSVLKEGGAGAFESLKGAFFEAIISAVVGGAKKKTSSTTLDIDLDLDKDKANLNVLRDIFDIPAQFNKGDFKANAGQTLKRTFAGQVIKNASKGYIPNYNRLLGYAENSPAGKRAMKTEKALAGSAEMGFDPRVGLGVFNKGQGSLKNAINEHLASGDSMSSLPTMGMKDQMAMSASKGMIPNFAGPDLRNVMFAGNRQFGAGLRRGPKGGIPKRDSRRRSGTGVNPANIARRPDRNPTDALVKGQLVGLGLSLAPGFIPAPSEGASFTRVQADKAIRGGFMGAATGASLGALTGNPFGIAGGAVAGGVIGVVKPLKDMADASKRATFEAEKMANIFKANSASVGAYSEALKALAAANTPEEKEAARKKLEAAGEGVTASARVELQSGEKTAGEIIEKSAKDAFDANLKAQFETAKKNIGGFRKKEEKTKARDEALNNITSSVFQNLVGTDVDLSKFSDINPEDVDFSDADTLNKFRGLFKDIPALAESGILDNIGTTTSFYANRSGQVTEFETIDKGSKELAEALLKAVANIQKGVDATEEAADLGRTFGESDAEEATGRARTRLVGARAGIESRFLNEANRNLLDDRSAATIKSKKFEQLRGRIAGSEDLTDAQKLTAQGQIDKELINIDKNLAQRAEGVNLQTNLAQISSEIAKSEAPDFADLDAVNRELADTSRSQAEILRELVKDNKLGLDTEGQIFQTLRDSLIVMERAEKGATTNASLIDMAVKDQTEKLNRERIKVAQQQFAQFRSFEGLDKVISSVFSSGKNLSTDQRIERTKSAAALDQQLEAIGLSKDSASRSGLQTGIKEGARLDTLTQLFDNFFPDARGNAKFKNAEDFAQKAARFNQKVFRDPNASAEDRQKAAGFQRILNDLKKEGIIFGEKDEKKVTGESISKEIENIADPKTKPKGQTFADKEAMMQKTFEKFALEAEKTIAAGLENSEANRKIMANIDQDIGQMASVLDNMNKEFIKSVGNVTITTNIEGAGGANTEEIANAINEAAENAVNDVVGGG